MKVRLSDLARGAHLLVIVQTLNCGLAQRRLHLLCAQC